MNTKTDPQKNLVEEQIDDDAQNGKVLKGSPKRTREAISDKSPPTKKQKRAVATRSFTSPKKTPNGNSPLERKVSSTGKDDDFVLFGTKIPTY